MKSVRTALAALVLLNFDAAAQQYVISTYAGGAPPLAAQLQGTSVSIGAPYFASPDLNAVFKLDPGRIDRVFRVRPHPRRSQESKDSQAG